ncbi:MAG: hypothetical protein BWY45_02872 [Euryarchaeota archaeon ADurb.Bin294]|nr:MAG: hypothetical protein BWY45_02872 [Euryarchaeota archaeon ADurb.Bin294]
MHRIYGIPYLGMVTDAFNLHPLTEISFSYLLKNSVTGTDGGENSIKHLIYPSDGGCILTGKEIRISPVCKISTLCGIDHPGYLFVDFPGDICNPVDRIPYLFMLAGVHLLNSP